MAKSRSRTFDYLSYLAVRFLFSLTQMLPYERACGLARVLAWLAYTIDKRHRLVALDNVSRAYPELSPGEVDALVRSTYRHFCTMVFEMMLLPRVLYPTTWRRYFELPHNAAYAAALLGNRPVLLVTGHLGNWEVGGFALGAIGLRTYAIARPLDNPWLHDFVMHRFRQRTGQTILAKHNDFDRIQAALASGGKLATLCDQDAGQRGLFVDFFGRPASTHKAIALLALEHNAPILVGAAVRTGRAFHYRCEVADVIEPGDYKGRTDAVPAITRRFTTALEQLVRGFPDQYLWLHRRWKHQPKASISPPVRHDRDTLPARSA